MTAPAFSEMLAISPTRVTLSQKSPIQILRLTNRDNKLYTMQASLRQWRQIAVKKGLKNTYSTTDQVMVTPEIFRLQPGAKQIIRIALTSPVPQKMQGTYRLFLHQIMPLQKTTKTVSKNRLKIALEMILPVFVTPITPVKSGWQWTIHHVTKNQYRVILMNTSDETLFVDHWSLVDNKKSLASTKTFVYLLPHQTYHWKMTLNEPIKSANIQATINDKEVVASANII